MALRKLRSQLALVRLSPCIYGGMMSDPDCPSVQTLWDRTHTARKGGRICSMCKEEVRVGEKYQTTGMTVDGAFEVWFRHYGAERYPSGCRKYAAADRAEAEAQFRKDELLFAPVSTDTALTENRKEG